MPFDLYHYLIEKSLISSEEKVKISPLAGGNINHISLVQTEKGSFIVKQAFSTTKFNNNLKITPQRIEAEHRAINVFSKRTNLPHIPKTIFFDRENNLLALQAVPTSYSLLTYDLLEGKINLELIKGLAGFYARIHNATYNDKYLESMPFSDAMYKEVKLGLFHGKFLATTKNKKIKENTKKIIEKSLRNRICLIHGDAQPKNILVHKDHFYVLDYEIARYGDPAHDIGNLLAHYLLAGIINFPKRKIYYQAIYLFFNEYIANIKFKKLIPKIKSNVLAHIAPIIYCRVDGTFKIEILDEKTKKSIRRIAYRLGEKPPQSFNDLFSGVEKEEKGLKDNKPILRKSIKGKKIF